MSAEKRELYRFRLPGGSYHVIAQSGGGAEARLWWGVEFIRAAPETGVSDDFVADFSGWNEYDERDQDEVLELLRVAARVEELEAHAASLVDERTRQMGERKVAEAERDLFKASYDQAEQENRRLREELERLKDKPARKERRRAEPAEGAEIPFALLQRPTSFPSIWETYLVWRREQRHPTNKAWAERQLAAMAEWGPEEAVEALEESMRQGWRGIFRPKGKQRDPEPVTRPAAPYHRPIGGAR